MDRNEAIARIKLALKKRSGKTWSVTGNRGTAWGWIDVTVRPRERNEYGYMSEAARGELALLFGLGGEVHQQGLSIPPDERDWHVARAEGAK
jgi:hypothetical protein